MVRSDAMYIIAKSTQLRGKMPTHFQGRICDSTPCQELGGSRPLICVVRYHQVAMKPEDADKTAFICKEGQFKFTTMLFRLCNAGATFQRLMDMIMAGLTYEVCLVYLDDMIVFFFVSRIAFQTTVTGTFEAT